MSAWEIIWGSGGYLWGVWVFVGPKIPPTPPAEGSNVASPVTSSYWGAMPPTARLPTPNGRRRSGISLCTRIYCPAGDPDIHPNPETDVQEAGTSGGGLGTGV